MKTTSLIAWALSAAIAQSANAQEWSLSRRAFTFHDHNLTINVISDGSGTLQILRGEAGRVEVAARAPLGIPGFAMGGREGDELRLSAVGTDQVDYLVVVPEDIRVRVLLPHRKTGEVASTRPTANYSWGAEPRGGGLVDLAAMTPLNGYYLSYHHTTVPHTLAIEDVGNLDHLEIRFNGTDFRLETDQPLTVRAGSPDQIDFRAGRPNSRLIASVPLTSRNFRLILGGKLALERVGGEIRSYCEQLVSQRLPDGRVIYSYTPSNRLICR
jgi:hypothetical protein